uniref:Succinyl-CoA:glutarate-CoA transferase n=1 Tax=Oncorhynchus mykiss TaxID=8022 RepID=A0A8K9WX48_ONCMY
MKIYSTVETDETGCIPQFAGTCGVLVENDLSRKLDQMGLDYDHVHKAAPRLLYCSISGTYLWLCPHLSTHRYDSIASAVSGMMHITGTEDGDPVRPGVTMTDLATGLYTYRAIMAALFDLTLLISQVACFTHIATNYLNSGKEARSWGTAHENIRCSATSMLSSRPGFLHS